MLYREVENKLKSHDTQLEQITLLGSTFGIKADGTDETEKINRFLSYVDSRNDISKIIFPSGTIVINDSIQFKNISNRMLKICGINTIIKLANQSNNFHNHKPMVCLYGNIDFSGFELDGNFDNNYYTLNGQNYYCYMEGANSSGGITKGSIAIALINANYTKVHNCKFRDISWSSCDVTSGSNIEIYENIFYNGAQDYVPVHNATNVYVHDNICYYPNNHALHAYSNCSYVTFENNRIYYENTYLKQYKTLANTAIAVDHSLYPTSEVLNTTIKNNIIKADSSLVDVHGIYFMGYPNTVDIKNNNIDVTGIGIFIVSPTLGKTNIQENKIKSNNICIYYRLVEDHGSINYDCNNKNGEIIIKDNNLYSVNSSCICIRTIINANIDVDNQIIKIKNNNYNSNPSQKNIFIVNINNKCEVYIDEPVTERLINTTFDINNDILGKLFIGKNYIKNLWVNNSFCVPSVQDDGNFIPALVFSRSNGTIKNFKVETRSDSKPMLLFNTNVVPTYLSSLQYTRDDVAFFDGKYVFISFDIRSTSSHNIIIELLREGEETIPIYKTNVSSQTDYKIRKLIYVPKSIKNTLRKTFKIQILIDAGSTTYTKLENFSIADVKIIEGCCINYGGDLINDNSIHSVNKLINKPLIFYTSVIPISGDFIRGDRAINITPYSGYPKSWVCVASGNPGTWVSEGNL